MSRQPVTKWAQRSDKVIITIEIPDAKDVKLTLQDAHLHFSASTGSCNMPYEIDFVLYDKINVHESKGAVGFNKVCYILKKAEEKWWSRLLRQGGKPPVFLKADWNKWIDENDEPEKEFEDLGFGDLEFSKLNMGDAEVDDETGEAKATENPPSAKEYEAAAADAGADHDAGSHFLGVDWSKMNTDMKKYLNMEHGAKQRARFVVDDDDDEEEEVDAADEDDDDDDEDEEEGDEKKEAKAPPADQNVEDKPLTPSEILNVQKHVQMILDMHEMANLMNALMGDGVAEDL